MLGTNSNQLFSALTMQGGISLQRDRLSATAPTEALARQVNNLVAKVDSATVNAAPSTFALLQGLKRRAEECALQAAVASKMQTGCAEDISKFVASAEEAVRQAEAVVKVAKHAAKVSDLPFGEEFSLRVAKALRAGVVVRQSPADHSEVCGRHLYTGVGLSYGCAGKLELAQRNAIMPEDEVAFTIDDCWISYMELHPREMCRAVALKEPGNHMGYGAVTPEELAPEACKKLPSVLRWAHEESFVQFLASQSERSLVLLLGSDSNGSITYEKMLTAVQLYDHYVPDRKSVV